MRIYGDENNTLILNELGKRIKDIRIKKAITQKEMAEMAGVSHSTVTRIENGDGATLDNLLKIMRMLGILTNIDLLIPEQELTPEDIFYNKTKAKRASKKKKIEKDWLWGDEE